MSPWSIYRLVGRLAALCEGHLQQWVRTEQGRHRVEEVLGRLRLGCSDFQPMEAAWVGESQYVSVFEAESAL